MSFSETLFTNRSACVCVQQSSVPYPGVMRCSDCFKIILATQLTNHSHIRWLPFTQRTHVHMPPHFTQHFTRAPARISRCHRAKNVSTYDTINKNTLLIRRPPFFALNVIITLVLVGPKAHFYTTPIFTVTPPSPL